MTIQKLDTEGRHILSQEPRAIALAPSGRLSHQQTESFTRGALAMLVPRKWEEVQSKLLLACQNPEFTKEAVYRRESPNGEVHEGLSIRFAEIAHALMRNVSVDNTVEFEDDLSIHYRITVSDTESNSTQSKTYRVSKAVERMGVRDDEIVLAERRNGKGQTVFLVPATDEQVASRAGALESRVKRQLVLSLIPVDIRSACLASCLELNKRQDATDPAAAVKQLVLEFLAQGIEVSDLKEYLGKPVTGATTAEIQTLRGILNALREGTTTWREIMESKAARAQEKSAKEAFIQQKQTAKAAASGGRKKASGTGSTTGGATAPAGDEAPKRRGRRTSAQIAADNAEAAAGAAPQGATERQADSTSSPHPPKSPVASRRADDDEEDEHEEDDGEGSAADHLT